MPEISNPRIDDPRSESSLGRSVAEAAADSDSDSDSASTISRKPATR
ncbi:MAG TPA: hypothetical protein VHW26_00460 [Solirubrobacteraceae bacterium]|nr:hypothetical protein [Solirubrobacteraceae bacterium]